jgi:hypothetical protein
MLTPILCLELTVLPIKVLAFCVPSGLTTLLLINVASSKIQLLSVKSSE